MHTEQIHLDRRRALGLLRGSLGQAERLAAVQHLLAGCQRCASRVAAAGLEPLRSVAVLQLRPSGGVPQAAGTEWSNAKKQATRSDDFEIYSEQSYDAVIARARDSARGLAESVVGDRALVGERLELLLEQPRRQQLLLRNSKRYRSPMLCHELLRRSFDERFRDAALMLRLAELGVQVAENLTDEDLRPALRLDLCAEAWSYLGNARRVSSDLRGADKAMRRAFAYLELGLGDTLLKARLLTFIASLRGDQRRFAECTRASVKACGLYRSLGEKHLLGRTLIMHGSYRVTAEGFESGISKSLLEEGLALVESGREPALVVLAMHNLVSLSCLAGRYREAWELLRECRGLYRRHLGTLACIKLLWLEGNLAAGLGCFERATEALTRSRIQLQTRGLGYDVALVSLDLALVELQRDRDLAARLLVEESYTMLRAEGIDREALAAVIVLRKALRKQQRPLELLRQVMIFLRHREIDAKARFRPGG